MLVLARGAGKVRTLEVTLGGEPPKHAGEDSLAALTRHIRERHERRRANWTKMQPLLQQAQAPLLQAMKGDAGATKAIDELRSLVLARRREKPTRKREAVKVEPRIVAGSGFSLKGPPYDQPFQSSAGNATASCDSNAGTYNFGMEGSGGSAAASAGVGVWFLALADDPAQRVAALVDYDYSWFDSSVWWTAHNDGSTNIWVWGASEGQWMVQQGGISPAWSDGTGWLDTHGSGGDGSDQFGRESIEAFFPVTANNWYQAWIWSEGSCDDAGFNPLGGSFAQQSQSMTVDLVVFGSLFG